LWPGLVGLAGRVGQTAEIASVNRTVNGFLVARLLKLMGYRYDHIGSWWRPTSEDPFADNQYRFESLTEFATTLYKTTVIAPIAERLGVLDHWDQRRTEWARRQWQFDTLTKIGDKSGPKFVFGHLLTPHPPYVTDREGDFVTREQEARWSFERRYVEQVIYTNEEIKNLVDQLLAVPRAERPIIVLQADEGPTPTRIETNKVFEWTTASLDELEMKFKLFTALYLPGLPESEVRRRIYQTFTPVNTFRLIFNLYLGGHFRLLPDRNYIADRMLEISTGNFRQDYEETFSAGLGEAIEEASASSRGQILNGPEISFRSGSEALAIARVTQTTQNDENPQGNTFNYVIEITLIDTTDGGWKADRVELLSGQEA
jgi:hypothetical protein